jgi:CheY-like chemotaxis protein
MPESRFERPAKTGADFSMARIVVVDNDPGFRAKVVNHLKSKGHEIEEAENGRAVVRMCGMKSIDMIVLEMYMPDVDGIETILKIRKKCPGCRIIAMTDGGRYQDFDVLRSAIDFGANCAFLKPFDVESLAAAVGFLAGNGQYPGYCIA